MPSAVVAELVNLLQQITATKAPTMAADHKRPDERRGTTRRLAQSEINIRRARLSYFSPALFGEPAWDILLLLYTHDDAAAPLTTSQLSELTAVPLTTAIRWLDYLESSAFITRERKLSDRRSVCVELTRKAELSLEDYFCGEASDESSGRQEVKLFRWQRAAPEP
ncbi:MarR family transcriptional regulator [Sphingomonas sp. LHG3406-1]|uniref:MarR family transcriptional regulator n=1 Tax=Sphingomonas sp. LHG3406-1 TaxID=2804617 RepID=UPI0026316E6D|nr:MarR family transcriptional regulator [Sphingomonas sp. LHG3406-1]